MQLSYILFAWLYRAQSSITIAIIVLLSASLLPSCEKSKYEGNPTPVQIFNSLEDDIALRVNLSGTHPVQYSTALVLWNKNYLLKDNVVYIHSFPQPIGLYSYADTLAHNSPLIETTLNLQSGAIYSMFIFGSGAKAEYILHKDVIPNLKKVDSVTNIRFVNLSEGQDISVNIKSRPDGSFIKGLSFRQISEFIELEANMSIANYEFEIRDQVTGDLLTTYSAEGINAYGAYAPPNKWYNRSNTLVFTGKKDGTGANLQKVVLMNNR